jgi:hypothetical protein
LNKYHIRFNHDHNGTGLVWRVFENGQENLVKHINIVAPVCDEITVENGVEKWNLCCYGYMTIANDKATIR